MRIPVVKRIVTWPYVPILGLSIITAMGAALRWYNLGFKSLWFDEAVIYWISQGRLSTIVTENASLNSAPPLFPVMVSLISMLGDTEAILRAIPFLAGVLCIPAMYALARRFVPAGAALAGAILIAIAPIQIRYSQELREYSLCVLLAILMVLAYDVFNQEPRWCAVGLTATVVVVSILTQYGLALLAVALSAVSLLIRVPFRIRERGFLPKWAFLQLASLAASIGAFYLALRYQWQPGGFAASVHLAGAYWEGHSLDSALLFLLGRTKDILEFSFPGYMYLVLFYAGAMLLVLSRDKWKVALHIVVPFLIVALAGIARAYPYHGSRQDLFLTPLLYLTVTIAIAYLLSIDPKKVLPVLFLLLMANKAQQAIQGYYPAEGQTAVGKIIAHMQALVQPGDPIYMCEDDPVLRYYLLVRYPTPNNPIVVGVQDTAPGPRDYLDQVDAMLEQGGKAWMLMVKKCGDMTPLLDHVRQKWSVELVEELEPDGQVYYVH